MSGRLFIVGLGPGNPGQITPEARLAIENSSVFFGYVPYIERLNLRSDQTAHASDNREELARARTALDLALTGRTVCMVSGGDPGVFAMAAAVIEAIDHGRPAWKELDLSIVPGITAMLAVAAKIGAPLGHDFCAISLSDNLKPWEIIEKRLTFAAQAGFAMAFYNPISKARPWQLGRAFEILRTYLPADVPVIFGRAAGRADEAMRIERLEDAQADMADMATCIIVGTQETRFVTRSGKQPLVYTPRFLKSEAYS